MDQEERLKAALADCYAIEREIGSGGMASVYVARDLKHERQVAVKVLRPELAAVLGAERFLSEIKVTANLQHPHILPLHDSGEAGGFLFYVMPFVDGESLRAKLDREKQLSVDEAVGVAESVASALDYAHRRGVVHRDIKPANILLHDGQPMVADFGIALAVRAAGGDRLTQTGLSLGTPQYMSPEQATGDRTLDARSDIYSLACVLYEMLAGEPPHTGPTAQAVIAKVLTDRPRPVTELRGTVPARVAEALDLALAKLPADRFPSAAAFSEALSHPEQVARPPASRLEGVPVANGRLRVLGALAGWLVAATLILIWLVGRPEAPSPEPTRHLSILLPDSAPLDFFGPATFGEGRPALTLSPDGRTLVYVARRGVTTLLYRRDLADVDVEPIPGTEEAYDPFFSPDGEWIGFFAASELRKVPLRGGTPVTIARVAMPCGAVWTVDDRILVSEYFRPLAAVSAAGGELTPLFDTGSTWPQALPGGGWLLGSDGRQLRLMSLESGEEYVIGPDRVIPADSGGVFVRGTYPRYVASGHIIYLSGNTLMALPFDLRHRRVLGPATPILNGVRRENAQGPGQYAVSEDGTLVYVQGADAAASVVVWADRSGQVLDTLPVPRGDHFHVLSSPDGRRVAVSTHMGAGPDDHKLLDLDSRLTRSLGAISGISRFWPDGSRIITWMDQYSIALPVSGSGPADTLMPRGWDVEDVEADGQLLLARGPADSAGMWLVSRDSVERSLQVTSEYGYWGYFAPGGRYLAYATDDGLFVAPTSDPGAGEKVAPAGVYEARWSRSGDALFYRDGPRWMTVPIATEGGLRGGSPVRLFEGKFLQVEEWGFDVGPGDRLLVLQGPPEETADRLRVVTNFTAELTRLVPRRMPGG